MSKDSEKYIGDGIYYDFTRPVTEEELNNPNCRIYNLYLEDEQIQKTIEEKYKNDSIK